MLTSGRHIAAARVFAGMEQRDLARAAGLHRNMISRYEGMGTLPKRTAGLTDIVAALKSAGVVITADPPGIALVAPMAREALAVPLVPTEQATEQAPASEQIEPPESQGEPARESLDDMLARYLARQKPATPEPAGATNTAPTPQGNASTDVLKQRLDALLAARGVHEAHNA